MSEIVTSENYLRAISIDKKIKANAQVAQESLYEVCKGLKEMRDNKLYKELGYQNFEDYSENEVGFTRTQSSKYIKIAESFTDENVNPGLHLGVSKLFLLSKLDEQEREKVMQKVDIEDVSKRELEKTIKALKEEKSKLEKQNADADEKISDMKARISSLSDSNDLLEERIEELENRPIDVAVADNSKEIENMRKAMDKMDKEWADKYANLQEESIPLIRKIESQKKRIEELENAEPPVAEPDGKEVFKIYLANAIDVINRLMGAVKQYPEYKSKAEELFRKTLEKMEEI